MRRFVLVALALAAAAGCRRGAEGGDEGGGTIPPVVGAQTAPATRRPFTQTLDAIGTVVPRPWAAASLSAPAAARVATVRVAVGTRVRRGDVLVELDHRPFDAEARSAEADVEAARQAYDRAQTLSGEGILARKEVELAAAELARAQAALVHARRAQELATLRAPIAGVVTRLDAVLGASVDPSQTLVQVADPSALDIVLELSPGEAARAHAGDSVSIVAGANAGGEPLGEGVVRTVSVTVDSATRSVAVRARLAHPTRILRIGETVFGRIIVGMHPGAVSVPVQALVPEGEGYRVYVVDSAGIAHARDVEVGARTETDAEILRGVAAGERVVTYGAYGVADSARIVPVKP